MDTFYFLLFMVACLVLFLPFKTNSRRQGIGLLLLGIVFFVQAVRFHEESRPHSWLWVVGAIIEIIGGLHLLKKGRKAKPTPPPSTVSPPKTPSPTIEPLESRRFL